ncbi:velvet factor [Chytriomyces cf. hyalinus JEL632]|nr:velvet factor [Chytriomyces cf. hyalinus JEL632]
MASQSVRLEIVQHPKIARVCGFSIPDRRPIQPPPVLKVTGREYIDSTAPLVVFASLWSRDLQHNLSYSHKAAPPFSYYRIPDNNTASVSSSDAAIAAEHANLSTHPVNPPPPPAHHQHNPQSATSTNPHTTTTIPRPKYNVEITEGYTQSLLLVGSLVSESMDLITPENEKGVFFVFADLAIRSSGFFRLKFELFHLGRQGPALASAVSDVFQAFSPKAFPGNLGPTQLTRVLQHQGIQIRTRDSTQDGFGPTRNHHG